MFGLGYHRKVGDNRGCASGAARGSVEVSRHPEAAAAA